MRPHLISKIVSLYDRVAHHPAKSKLETSDATPVAIDPEQTVTTPVELYDEYDLRITGSMPAVSVDTRDEGDLYGVHTPIASDRHVLDNDHAFDAGQNWLEALEEQSIEGGPLPEHEIDIVDDADNAHPHTDREDRPIADLGSGGRGGL